MMSLTLSLHLSPFPHLIFRKSGHYFSYLANPESKYVNTQLLYWTTMNGTEESEFLQCVTVFL